MRLGAIGTGWTGLWAASTAIVFAPLWSLLIPLAGLAGAAVIPLTRRARWAKKVISKWDEIRVERGFEDIQIVSDPRLAAAQTMAERILRNRPDSGRLATAVEALSEAVREGVHDLQLLSLLAAEAPSGHEVDAEVQVEERVAHSLKILSAMSSAVISRDAERVTAALEEAESTIRRESAKQEVDKLLS